MISLCPKTKMHLLREPCDSLGRYVVYHLMYCILATKPQPNCSAIKYTRILALNKGYFQEAHTLQACKQAHLNQQTPFVLVSIMQYIALDVLEITTRRQFSSPQHDQNDKKSVFTKTHTLFHISPGYPTDTGASIQFPLSASEARIWVNKRKNITYRKQCTRTPWCILWYIVNDAGVTMCLAQFTHTALSTMWLWFMHTFTYCINNVVLFHVQFNRSGWLLMQDVQSANWSHSSVIFLLYKIMWAALWVKYDVH